VACVEQNDENLGDKIPLGVCIFGVEIISLEIEADGP